MKFMVVCGEFDTVVESDTPRAAAEQAFLLLNLKSKKPSLSKLITIVKPDKTEIYLSTSDFLKN